MPMRFMILFFIFACAFLPAVPSHARTETIAAVVNEDAITVADVEDRTRLILASSNLPDTAEIREKVRPQIVNALIEEQIKMQEARHQGITVSQNDIQQGFATIAQQNKMTAEQFKELVTKSGLNISTMYRQIEAQIAWGKVVQKELRPKIMVTDKDIDDYLDRLHASKGLNEYLLAEILLPVDDENSDSKTRQLADRLASEIRAGKTRFSSVAQQFSKAAGAEQGGDLGWVQQGQLEPELDQAVHGLNKGDISAPIRTTRGYHLLLLRDTRNISDENMPTRDQVFSMIGLQRLERAQRRYYMDLRATAFIENRVAS